jgi:hypothetical protein
MIAYSISAGDIEKLEHVRVVSKGKNSHVLQLFREEIFRPEDRFFVRPSGFAITREAMDEHDTEMCVRYFPNAILLIVVMGSYSAISCSPSATVLSPCSPAVENNSSVSSSRYWSFSLPLFSLLLVLKR